MPGLWQHDDDEMELSEEEDEGKIGGLSRN